MAKDAGFERYGKRTRRDVFLTEMDRVVPIASYARSIALHTPKNPTAGTPHRRLERMLRIHFW